MGEATSVIGFDGDTDRLNPQNWPISKKIYTTALWALTTCWITFASAIYSAGTEEISREFNVTYDVANAGTSLLIFGFALGPMLWAPICEVYGRKWPALAVCCHHPNLIQTWRLLDRGTALLCERRLRVRHRNGQGYPDHPHYALLCRHVWQLSHIHHGRLHRRHMEPSAARNAHGVLWRHHRRSANPWANHRRCLHRQRVRMALD